MKGWSGGGWVGVAGSHEVVKIMVQLAHLTINYKY